MIYPVDSAIQLLNNWGLVDSAIQCLNHGASFPKEQNKINKFTARVSDKKSQVAVWWNYRFSFKQASCVKQRERERIKVLVDVPSPLDHSIKLTVWRPRKTTHTFLYLNNRIYSCKIALWNGQLKRLQILDRFTWKFTDKWRLTIIFRTVSVKTT